MDNLRVTLKGPWTKTRKALASGDLVDKTLRPGFEQAGTIVEGAATENAHRVTGKLQRSLGYYLEGKGANLEAHIGPQPGMGQPARYTKAETSHWKTPRDGVNKGDPQEYAQYEEGSPNDHPFLEPALDDNLDRVERVIVDAWRKAFGDIR